MTVNDPISADEAALSDRHLDIDRLFDAFSNPRRRYVLVRLHESGTPLELDDLAEGLARWVRDDESSAVPEEDVTSVYLSLVHIHLPKLDDAGLIEYDREENVVALTATSDELTSLVDLSTAG